MEEQQPTPMLVYEFDSTRQRDTWRRLVGTSETFITGAGKLWRSTRIDPVGVQPTQEANTWFRGALRLAHLSTDRVIVTDTQILDGVFFLRYGPAFVAHAIGELRPTLEIRGRAPSLAECLRQFFIGTHDRPKNYGRVVTSAISAACTEAGVRQSGIFSSNAGRRGHRAIATAPPSKIASTITRQLEKQYGLPTGSLQGLADSWNAWIEASDQQQILYTEYEPRADFTEISRRAEPPDLYTETGRALFDEVSGQRMRSLAHRAIDNARAGVSSLREPAPEVSKDIETIEDWYDFVYQHMIAVSQHADWLRLSSGPSWARITVKAQHRASRTTLDGQAFDQLRRMGDGAYEYFVFQHEATILRWRSHRNKRNTNDFAFALREFSDGRDLYTERRQTRFRIVVFTTLMVLAIAANFVSWLGPAWAVTIAVIVVVLERLVDLVPSFLRLRQIGDKKLESTVFITGGS